MIFIFGSPTIALDSILTFARELGGLFPDRASIPAAMSRHTGAVFFKLEPRLALPLARNEFTFP